MNLKNILMFLLISLLILNLADAQNVITSSTQRKIAIAVGVSNYEYAGILKNTLNDATDISNKLRLLGFDVTSILDPDIKSFNLKIDSITKLLTNKDIFMFYFSGHGAEYNGENYLFVKNSNPTSPTDMPYETYPIGKLLGRIEYAKVQTNIIILDACRSNPFVRSWTKDGNPREGLMNINAPAGSFIGFAASPGKTASDGIRKNGTYTEAILKYIELKNITIDELFNKVNKEVRIQSAGKQIPFKNSSLEDNYYFNFDNTFKEIYTAQNGDGPRVSPINRPIFKMPKVVTGYRDERLNSFGVVSINKTTFDKNEFIELSLSLFNKATSDKATPVFVDIVKRNSPTSVTQIYTEQFQLIDKNNIFRMSTAIPSGTYELTVGFYLLDEINQEYPPFYKKIYSFTIL